ncbi:MAG: peptidoglycan-binding domain-containing protein [Propionibacteriaceae bacterium]|nr:peptidoglycan-binding domain-containing protein [Propionibacteriaceae bacterium]
MAWSNDWNKVRPTRVVWRNDWCHSEGTVWGKGHATRDVYSKQTICPAWDGAVDSHTWCSHNNKNGDGSAVKRIQRKLNDAISLAQQVETGVPAPLAVDGVLGPKSHSAIVWFQKGRGLKDDGLVGKKTWDKLATTPGSPW